MCIHFQEKIFEKTKNFVANKNYYSPKIKNSVVFSIDLYEYASSVK